jgi:predicted dehydrogenase
MSAPLRAAFIGGSLESAVGYTHYAAARLDGCFDLVAGCFSTRPENNRAAGARYGVTPHRIHPDWQTLLAHESANIDAVVVLTPTPSHADIVAACLEARLPVICEKALACTSADIAALQKLERETNGFLAVTYNYSGYPMVRALRQMIRDGKLGRVRHIQISMPQEGFSRRASDGAPAATPQSWRLQDGRVPTLYLDLGVHLHHLVYFLTALKPLEVSALHASYGNFPGLIDTANAIALYENNVSCAFSFDKTSLGQRNGLQVRIQGEFGAASWMQSEPETLELSCADGRRELFDRSLAPPEPSGRFKPGHPAGFIEAFANLYADMANALRRRQRGEPWRSAFVPGADIALEGLHFLEAMTDAAETRAWRRVRGQHHCPNTQVEAA